MRRSGEIVPGLSELRCLSNVRKCICISEINGLLRRGGVTRVYTQCVLSIRQSPPIAGDLKSRSSASGHRLADIDDYIDIAIPTIFLVLRSTLEQRPVEIGRREPSEPYPFRVAIRTKGIISGAKRKICPSKDLALSLSPNVS